MRANRFLLRLSLFLILATLQPGRLCSAPAAAASAAHFAVGEASLQGRAPRLNFTVRQSAENSAPSRLKLKGEAQYVALERLAPGTSMGRMTLKAESFQGWSFAVRALSLEEDSSWSFEVFPEEPRYAHLAVAQGKIRNTAGGFELDLWIAPWLEGSFSSTAASEGDFVMSMLLNLELRLPSEGSLSYQFSTGRSAGPVSEQSTRLIISR